MVAVGDAGADTCRAWFVQSSVGFVYGAYMESFYYCVYSWFVGCCIASVVRRPDTELYVHLVCQAGCVRLGVFGSPLNRDVSLE